MQRIKKTAIICLAALSLFSFPSFSYSLGISAGISTWYTHWDMEDNTENRDMGEAIMYGPMIALRFSSAWSLSSVFLYGKFESDNDESGGEPDTIKRIDSDTVINYSVNKYFRIYAGFKYMGYDFSMGEHFGYGPGAGIGAILPVTQQFFLMANISGMYLWSTEKEDDNGSGISTSEDYHETGFNTSITAAYFIPAASVTLSLGFRYQFFKTEPDDSSSPKSSSDLTFYGVTFSAVYSFDI